MRLMREQISHHPRLNKTSGMMGMRQQEMDNAAWRAYAVSHGERNNWRQIQ
jgi:hypothetical protein